MEWTSSPAPRSAAPSSTTTTAACLPVWCTVHPSHSAAGRAGVDALQRPHRIDRHACMHVMVNSATCHQLMPPGSSRKQQELPCLACVLDLCKPSRILSVPSHLYLVSISAVPAAGNNGSRQGSIRFSTFLLMCGVTRDISLTPIIEVCIKHTTVDLHMRLHLGCPHTLLLHRVMMKP